MESTAEWSAALDKAAGGPSRTRRWRGWNAYWFLAPALLLYLLFFVYPLGFSLFLSVHEWNMVSPDKLFVGWANYSRLLRDEVFWKSLVNSLLYVLYTVPVGVVAGLLLALAVESLAAAKSFYRTLFYLPVVSSVAVVSIVWELMYNPAIGTVNKLLAVVGLPGANWLNDPRLALGALAVIGIWKHLGANMVLFIAGRKAIDQGLYEAAAIDGAGRLQQLRHITVPLLSPMTFFVLVMSVISSFQVFATIQIMTQGGPSNSTNVFVYQIYKEAFRFFDIGAATATSTLFMLFIGLLTVVQLKLGQKYVHYQ